MNVKKKLGYDILNGVVGFVLMVSLIGVFFSHLRLGELQSIENQIAMSVSTDLQDEQNLMENVRIISAAAAVFAVSLALITGPGYYRAHPNAEWEAKKGAIGGLIMIPIGILLFGFGPDIFLEATGLSMITVGLFASIGNVGFLAYFTNSQNSKPTHSGSYCTGCGEAISTTVNYCPNCGADI